MTRKVLLTFAVGFLLAIGAIGYVTLFGSHVRTVLILYPEIPPVTSTFTEQTNTPVAEEAAPGSIFAQTIPFQVGIVQQKGTTYYTEWIAGLVYDSLLTYEKIPAEVLSSIRTTLGEAEPKDITDDVRLLDPSANTEEQIIEHLLGMVERLRLPEGTEGGPSDEEWEAVRSFERNKIRLALLAHLGMQREAQGSFILLCKSMERMAASPSGAVWGNEYPPALLLQYFVPRIPVEQGERTRLLTLIQKLASPEAAIAAIDSLTEQVKTSRAPNADAARAYLPEYAAPDVLCKELQGMAARSLSETHREARRLKDSYKDACDRVRLKERNSLWGELVARVPWLEERAERYPSDATLALLMNMCLLEQVQHAAEQSNRCALLGALCSAAFALEDYRAANGAYPDTIDAVRPSAAEALAFLEGPALGVEYEYRKPVSSSIGSELRTIRADSIQYARTSDGYAWRITDTSKGVAAPVEQACWRVFLPGAH